MNSHLIDRVKFDIQASDTSEAKEIQDKIFSICRYQLEPALDASMAEEADQFSLVKNQLKLDLGYIPKDVLESQLIPRLLEAFSLAIADLKPEYQSKDKLQTDLEALRLFLEKGAKHWSKGEDFDPLSELIIMLENYWPAFLKFLKRTTMQMQVSTRLVSICTDKIYRQLITKLRTSDSDFILGFVKSAVNVMERTKTVTQPKSHWEASLKALILHDLIKNHNSLFNRKMFIHRQLMGLAARHRVDYLELLRLFNELLADKEIAYKYHTSLPALIKELTDDAHLEPDQTVVEKASPEWLILFDQNKWEPRHGQLLHDNWKTWVSQYPGEMKQSFESELRTVDQVDFIVDQLSDEMADDLIAILIPHLSKYVLSYKRSVIRGNKESNTLTTAEENLRRTLNFLIISYLTLDMGSGFNKREFFTQQIVRLSRHYNLVYDGVVTFLIDTLESTGEPILFGMLELIRQIGENLIPTTDAKRGPKFKTQDELELLFHYLKKGRLHAEMLDSHSAPPFDFLLRVAGNDKYTIQLLDFVQANRGILMEKVRIYDTAIYLQLIKVLLAGKVSLSSQEVKIILNQIKKHLRQSVDQDLFRSYVFEYISGLGKKIKAEEVRKYDLDDIQDPYSLLCRFLIIKLSLDEFYKEKLKDSARKTKSISKALTYDQAYAQLFASLDHLSIPEKKNQYRQAQLQSSLSKILESKQESQSLLHSLNLTQLLLLLRTSNKVARYKVLHLLADNYLIIRILIEKIKVRVINDDDLIGWEQIIQLAYSSQESISVDQLEKSLDLLVTDSKIKKHITDQIDHIRKHQKEHNNDEMDKLAMFFDTAKLPKGWSLSAIETLFLKHYNQNYKSLFKVLATVVYRREVIERLHELLGKNILIRWTRIIMGDDFEAFNQELSYLLDIISRLEKAGGADLPDQATMERLSMLMLYEYQFRKVSFEVLVLSFLRYYSSGRSIDHKLFASKLQATLKSELDQIQPELLKRRANEMLQILSKNLPVIEEELGVSNQEDFMPDDSYKIENAGLILTWPFLKNLFTQLDYLTDDGSFKSTYEQSLAVRLLQYAVTGETDQPEYNMTLNKLLCGYPLVEPLERTPEVSEEDKKLADSMLEGLIANWSKLGNTSAEGLRNTFLIRKGSLTREENNWTLRVEKKGMDVLLDFLPWTITNVKTPWLEGMLFVEWR